MAIVQAECDSCGTAIRPREGDELYSLKTGEEYCEGCYNQRFEDLIPPEEEDD